MTSKTPPRLAAWLLRHLCCSENNDAILGDLAERYQAGKTRAWYWKEIAVAIAVNARSDIRGHKLIGFVMGAVAVGVSVASPQSDPHLRSVFPNIISVLVAPCIIFFAARRWRGHGSTTAEVTGAVRRAALIAAFVFGISAGVGAWWWFANILARAGTGGMMWNSESAFGGVFGFVAGFLLMFLLILASGYLAAKLPSRGIAKTAM